MTRAHFRIVNLQLDLAFRPRGRIAKPTTSPLHYFYVNPISLCVKSDEKYIRQENYFNRENMALHDNGSHITIPTPDA